MRSALAAALLAALMLATGCRDEPTCVGEVVGRVPNADGTITLKIRKQAGRLDSDVCRAMNLRAATVHACDAGTRYPQCSTH